LFCDPCLAYRWTIDSPFAPCFGPGVLSAIYPIDQLRPSRH
jgi:hypothetical protein